MSDVLRFAVLGLGPAAVYCLAAQGIVAIRIGSGVVNLAHGAIAAVGAATYETLAVGWQWPTALALAGALVATAALGLAVHALVVHPLRGSGDLVRLLANVGVLVAVSAALTIAKGPELRRVPSFYPSGSWHLGDVALPHDRLAMLALAVAATVALHALAERSPIGLAVRASAVDPVAAQALGWSRRRLEATTWVVGGALAGLAGVAILPVGGYAATTITLVVLPGLAAALIGGLRSFPGCLAGALVIGIGQSLLVRFGEDTVGRLPGLDSLGWSEALPFVVVVVTLFVRSTALPRRGEHHERLPSVGRAPGRPVVVLAALVAAGAVVLVADAGLVAAITTSAIAALFLLSLVLLVGLCGQVSLAQLAIAGVAALVAGRLSDVHQLAFPIAAMAGLAVAGVVGALFAVPAFRTRGVNLAIVTLGLGYAVEKVVFANPAYTGGFAGTRTLPPSLFGIELDAGLHPERYALLVLVAVAAVSLVLANVRAGSIGRALLAVRANELAARSIGIDVRRAKVGAFAAAAVLAGLAGVLAGFRFASVDYARFDVLSSISLVLFAVIGGIGYLRGALVGALLAPGGVLEHVLGDGAGTHRWVSLVSGVALVAVLVLRPDGLAAGRRRTGAGVAPPATPAPEATTVPGSGRLVVEGLRVSFGAEVVVDGLSLDVAPGTIVAVIGPNGAGKSTALDAIGGFVASEGSVRVGARELRGLRPELRARAGLARCFQHLELFDDLTVAENLAVSTRPASLASIAGEVLRPRRPTLGPELEELLADLGLVGVEEDVPAALSHGQRRMVAVARAVATGAPVLLLDEPAAGLDDTETGELAVVLRHLAERRRLAIVLVEHRLDLVFAVSDHVVALDHGCVVFEGPPDAARADPHLRASYLGDVGVPALTAPVDA